MGHAERTHALLSASSAHRWMVCTPSARLEAQFPDTVSEAAQEGTLAHELAEMKLRNYFYTPEFSKRKLSAGITKLRKNPLWDNEMLSYTDEYLDYITQAAMSFEKKPYVAIEKRVDFAAYVPGGFGTADCILISNNTLWVIDFKYGKVVSVSAEGNPQLALYALGAYELYKMLYPIEQVKLSIVQPRVSGDISEWACPLSELLAFGNYVKERAELADKGDGAYAPSEKTCRFCRAKAQCHARSEENVKLAFFADKKPPLISDQEVGKFLRQGEDVSRWLKDLQDYALKQCLAGKEIPGWKAVEGRGSREWTDMDEAFACLTGHGIPEAILWEKKPLTLAQVEKEIGKKDFAEYAGSYVVKKPGKPTLVKDSDKRPAVTNQVTAEEVFKDQEED